MYPGWAGVDGGTLNKIRKNTPAADKKRNILRNDDLVYMYPGWAGVDGGTLNKIRKNIPEPLSADTCLLACLNECSKFYFEIEIANNDSAFFS